MPVMYFLGKQGNVFPPITSLRFGHLIKVTKENAALKEYRLWHFAAVYVPGNERIAQHTLGGVVKGKKKKCCYVSTA